MMILSVQMLRRCSLKNVFFLLHCPEEKYHVIAVDRTLKEHLSMSLVLPSFFCGGNDSGGGGGGGGSVVLLVRLVIKCYRNVKLSLTSLYRSMYCILSYLTILW